VSRETIISTGDHATPAGGPDEPVHSLQADGVSAAGSIVMAVAGSAPAYSIAATTAALVAAAGLASPAALLWCGLPMLGIAWAFAYLGRADVHAGAAYSWVGRALHPVLGFFSGWALVVSATIFMVAGALPAGAATVALINPSQANNVMLVTGIGAIWSPSLPSSRLSQSSRPRSATMPGRLFPGVGSASVTSLVRARSSPQPSSPPSTTGDGT
jgi:amino acid transporter